MQRVYWTCEDNKICRDLFWSRPPRLAPHADPPDSTVANDYSEDYLEIREIESETLYKRSANGSTYASCWLERNLLLSRNLIYESVFYKRSRKCLMVLSCLPTNPERKVFSGVSPLNSLMVYAQCFMMVLDDITLQLLALQQERR